MENASSPSEFDKTTTPRIAELQALLLAIESLCQSLGVVFLKNEAEEILYRGIGFDPNYSDDDLVELVSGRIGLKSTMNAVTASQIHSLLKSQFRVAWRSTDGSYWVFAGVKGRKLVVEQCSEANEEPRVMSIAAVEKQFALAGAKEQQCIIVEAKLMTMQGVRTSSHSSHGNHAHSGHDHHHGHLRPTTRLLGLLRLEFADVLAILIFGLAAGLLGLASPLAVEWVVTTVGFGRYLQPLFVLAIILFVFLGFLSAMRILQSIVVEILQRRLLVRFVGDLTHRLPAVRLRDLEGVHGPELLNRYFDIVTIQKAIASLLLDGISLILSTLTGMLLLAFYHPFLLGFDIILLLCMTVVTWILGRGAVRSAIDESLIKYRLAFWLQQIIAYPTAFRLHGGNQLAINQANILSLNYLEARKRHFQVLIRQIVFAGALQAIASTALLGLGGYLVITEKLTMGQLVASELVVTVIVGAFAKVGKSLENFYDMLAALDKVGHVLDLQPERTALQPSAAQGPADVRWSDLSIRVADGHSTLFCGSGTIAARQHTVIRSAQVDDSSSFLKAIGCLQPIEHGFVEIDKYPVLDAALASRGQWLGYAGAIEIFEGTIQENVGLARSHLSAQHMRSTLERVGLWDTVSSLPDGLRTKLHAEGKQFTHDQRVRLMIARATLASPRVLLVDGILDHLSDESRQELEGFLCGLEVPWTCLISTARSSLNTPLHEVRIGAEKHS